MNQLEFENVVKRLISRFIIRVIIFTTILLIIESFSNYLMIGKDSTDGENRSNLILHIDNLSGCHYLSSKNGGLTPRLNNKKQHICK